MCHCRVHVNSYFGFQTAFGHGGRDGAGRQNHSLRSFNFGSYPRNVTYPNVVRNDCFGEMRQGIKIKVVREPDDDRLFQFEIRLSNGQSSTALAFWGYGDNFKEFGYKLTDFPNGSNDTVTYELGEDKNSGQQRWAYYLLLHVFCFDPSGQSAMKVIVDKHADTPDHHRGEFYIKAEPASLNRLGQELGNWNPENTKEFEWISN